MEQQRDFFLKKTLDISRDMLDLANNGEAESTDAGCSVLFGIVRDCSFKIKTRVEEELAIHSRQKASGKRAGASEAEYG